MGGEDKGRASVLGDDPSRADLARACHEIIGAASSLILNVEFLAKITDPAQQEAVDDSRRSIDVIVALARAIRQAIEKEPVNR
jgi:hypothetical protein